jgi:hypothetical protein
MAFTMLGAQTGILDKLWNSMYFFQKWDQIFFTSIYKLALTEIITDSLSLSLWNPTWCNGPKERKHLETHVHGQLLLQLPKSACQIFCRTRQKHSSKHHFQEKDRSGVDWTFSWSSSSQPLCPPHNTKVRQNHTSKKQLLQTIRRCPSIHLNHSHASRSGRRTQISWWRCMNWCGHVSRIAIILSMLQQFPLCFNWKYAACSLISFSINKWGRDPAFVSEKKGGKTWPQIVTWTWYMFHFIFLPYYWILETAGLWSMHVQSSRHVMHCLDQCKFLSVLGFSIPLINFLSVLGFM